MIEIITVQHCQSEQHLNGMVGSWTDWSLTKLGVVQANAIGRSLRDEIKNLEQLRFYSSDLLRAKKTAQLIAGKLQLTPAYCTELREQFWGSAVGKSMEWVMENKLQPSEFSSSMDYRIVPDAESKRELYARAAKFIEMIIQMQDKRFLVVSHGAFLEMFIAAWLKIPCDLLGNIELRGIPGGVSFLSEENDGRHVLQKFNDLAYKKE